ncbi:MAG: response regulator [Desulfobacteraceae bacterium]|nr:response regulator [Desulfobacteraceae bacterium]
MGVKILVIEDNRQNRYLITYLLEHKGYKVLQAVNGIAGIRLSIDERPDLILLDIQLPDMDGYAVAETLTADPTTSNIPIVAVTSYAMVGDREQALSAGCRGYIEKPIDPENFASQIESFLPGNTDTDKGVS